MKQGEQPTLHQSCMRSAMVDEMVHGAEVNLEGMCESCVGFYLRMIGVAQKVREWRDAYVERLRQQRRTMAEER